MKFPDILSTGRPDVALERVTRTNVGAYIVALHANQNYLKQHHVPGPATKPKARMDALRDVITGLWDERSLDMGIWRGDSFVGAVSLTPDDQKSEAEVGCWLVEAQAGHGYATVALQAIAHYGQENYARVITRVAADNSASLKLVERCGFQAAEQIGDVRVFELPNSD